MRLQHFTCRLAQRDLQLHRTSTSPAGGPIKTSTEQVEHFTYGWAASSPPLFHCTSRALHLRVGSSSRPKAFAVGTTILGSARESRQKHAHGKNHRDPAATMQCTSNLTKSCLPCHMLASRQFDPQRQHNLRGLPIQARTCTLVYEIPTRPQLAWRDPRQMRPRP